MALTRYLAITAGEIAENPDFSTPVAWMACRFSPTDQGLCGLPQQLPPGSLLTLNDSIPIRNHDPKRIAAQLTECIGAHACTALLLDLQRPANILTAELADFLLQCLPCPVIVSELYARELNCPVFLPPVPPSVPLAAHLAPWKGRNIWLEIGLDGEQITLTEAGSSVMLLPHFVPPEQSHWDKKLHCHYRIEVGDEARFTLWRTEGDLQALMEEAEKMGVSGIVGLYQEFEHFASQQ